MNPRFSSVDRVGINLTPMRVSPPGASGPVHGDLLPRHTRRGGQRRAATSGGDRRVSYAHRAEVCAMRPSMLCALPDYPRSAADWHNFLWRGHLCVPGRMLLSPSCRQLARTASANWRKATRQRKSAANSSDSAASPPSPPKSSILSGPISSEALSGARRGPGECPDIRRRVLIAQASAGERNWAARR